MGQRHLFLDSGAFSAWSKGKAIRLDSYIDFIREHGPAFDLIAPLDVIPRSRTQSGIAEAADGTWANMREMERQGLSPIPVVHCGETANIIARACSGKYPFVAVGGLVGTNRDLREEWLQGFFEYLGRTKRPIAIHGFGLSLGLMHRYPWDSMDSTIFTYQPALGNMLCPAPKLVDGSLTLDPSILIMVSVKRNQPARRGAFEIMPRRVQGALIEDFRRFGFELDELRDNPYSRTRYTLRAAARWAAARPLAADAAAPRTERTAWAVNPTGPSPAILAAIFESGIDHLLYSYASHHSTVPLIKHWKATGEYQSREGVHDIPRRRDNKSSQAERAEASFLMPGRRS